VTNGKIAGIVAGLNKGRVQVERERLGDPATVTGEGDFIAFSTPDGVWIYSVFKVEEVELSGTGPETLLMFVLPGVSYLVKAHESILMRMVEAWEERRLRKIRSREGVHIHRVVSDASPL
jgi:hypothetical protein